MTETILTINGISTSVKHRSGSGPAIVCIPGNSMSQKIFNPLWDELNLSSYPLVTYDLPGHGDSARPSNPEEVYSFPGYAKHLEQLIDELKLEKVVLFGFCMGVNIAFEAAGNNIGTAVKGIFSIANSPLHSIEDMGSAFTPLPHGASLFVENIEPHHAEIIAEQITGDKSIQDNIVTDILSTDPAARKFLFENIFAGKCRSEHDFLKSTDIPVQFVFSSNDKLLNPEYRDSEKLSLLMGSNKTVLTDEEHLPSFEPDSETIKLFTDFMKGFSA